MTHKTELGLFIPNSEDLYCINCKVNPLHMQHVIIKSLFHCKILTCRLIIYTIKCCIASPSVQDIEDAIHIIVSKKFYLTGKLQKYLTHLKTQFTDPEPVHPKVYEACLKYTFTYKISSHWKLIGKSFYLHDINFTSLPSTNIDAVEWNILYKDNNTKLQIIPMKVNVYPLNLASLSLTPSILNNFMTNPHCSMNSIDLTLFHCPWVYVLPKLTKAKIIKVSKILPANSSFEDYNVLRRHWKNMYSYRLPKSSHGMLFYEVVFTINPNQSFIYPDVCILSKMPEVLMCEDKNEVTSTFLKDLSTNVHSVCNNIIKIENLYPKLSIEYLSILKRKKDNNEEFNFDETQSSFFKTPTEHGMKPSNTKTMLSSLFTFKGIENICSPMTNYNQQVLSIMDNQKEKEKSKIKKGNRFMTTTNEIPMSKTVLPYENICSFYEIPSMHTTHSEWFAVEKPSTELDGQNKNDQISKKKPIIKCVENVNFDLNELKRIRKVRDMDESITIGERNFKPEPNLNHDQKNLCEQNNFYNKFSSKLENSSQEVNVCHNNKFNKSDQNLQLKSDLEIPQLNQMNSLINVNKSNSSQIEVSTAVPIYTDAYKSKRGKKELQVQSEIGSSMNKSKTFCGEPKSLLLKKNNNQNEKLSSDKLSILKSETQQFAINDEYSSMNIDACLTNSVHSSPSLLHAFNKQRDEYLHNSQSSLNSEIGSYSKKKKILNESQSLKSMTKQYECHENNNTNNFSHSFTSKFNSMVALKSKCERNLNNDEMNSSIESDFSLFNIKPTDQLEEKSSHSLSKKFKFEERNHELNKDYFNENHTYLDKTQCSWDLTKNFMNIKSSQKLVLESSPIYSSNNKYRTVQEMKNDKLHECNFNEHQMNLSPILTLSQKQRQMSSPESNVLNQNLQEEHCRLKNSKTPPFSSIFNSDDESDNTSVLKNTSHSTTKLHKIDNKLYETSEKNISSNSQYGDFTSILSESSNESQSDNYESCKQVFEEALTFENQQF